VSRRLGQLPLCLRDSRSPDLAPNPPHAGVILDTVGNLYGTTAIGGVDGIGTVFEITQ